MKEFLSKIVLRWGRNVWLLVTGVLTGGLVLLLCVTRPPLLVQIDLKMYDMFLARATGEEHLGVTAVVDVDEASLSAGGQWPWPRYRLAMLIDRLLQAGAAAVALDIMLAEPDRTSVDAVLRDLQESLGVKARVEELPEFLRDNDRLLAETLRGKPVVLGGFLTFAPSSGQGGSGGKGASEAEPEAAKNLPEGLNTIERAHPGAIPVRARLTEAEKLVTPLPELANAAAVAFFNAGLDEDGLVRRIPVLAQVKGRIYANLGLRALMLALGARNLRLTTGPDGLQSIGVGKFTFPVSSTGSMLVLYRGPARTFPYISAIDALEGRFQPEQVHGKIIFIGSSAAGLMDIRATPLDRYTPGVEVHANMVDAVLSGRSISVPPWEMGLQVGLVALMTLFCLPLFCRASPVAAVTGSVFLLGGAYVGSWYLFGQGAWVTPLWTMLTVSAEGAVLTLQRFFLADRDRRRLRNVFSRYVSPEVVSRIADRGETVLRGEQRELSVMFTDLRGFTSISEKLTPEQVVALLNRYFTPMTGLVRGSKGTLDKFIGDCLMAFWNAPLDVPDHPRLAVDTALSMLDALAALNTGLERELGFRLGMGAGVHTGPAYVGNMGSDDLTSYTAIGDTVNLASRLEGLCKIYGVPLVLSGDTAVRCKEDVLLLPVARLRVKGRVEPVDVFTALRPQAAEQRGDELKLWPEAIFLFRNAVLGRDSALLTQSVAAFSALNARWPGPLWLAYLDACTVLKGQKPQQWTEVWTMSEK